MFQLAEALHLTAAEVMDMAEDEFMLWIAHFKRKKAERP